MIYVECKPDKALISHIVGGEIKHLGNKSEVCKTLERTKNSIGIIDEDPHSHQPPYIKKIKFIKSEENLKLYRDENNKNKIILICPRLEEWILEIVREEKIDIRDYGFSEDPNQFHNEVNLKIPKFQQLINKLKRSKNKRLLRLKEFISN